MTFTDNRTLKQIHAQLMEDLQSCDNMLTGTCDDDPDLVNDMESICEQLGQIEEITSLKWGVDCDCFYHKRT